MKIKKWKLVIAIIALLIVGTAVCVFLNLPKPLSSSDAAYDLTQLADGTYMGSCDNGMVKVAVAVEIQGNAIANIRITEHDNGLGTPAEAIADDIIEQQSIEIDAISGATLSSKTIMKAVENALSGTGE